MKRIRKISLTLHLWLGLFAAIFLFVEGVTGGIMAWGSEILRLLNLPGPQTDMPIYHVPTTGTTRLSLEALAAAVEAKHPGLRLRNIMFSRQPDLAWSADFQVSSLIYMRVWFDPSTGEDAAEQVTGSRGGWLEMLVNLAYRLHRDVIAGPVILLLTVSGLVLWWPRKILIPRGPAQFARTNLELHSAIGLYSSLLLALFSVTSVIMIYSRPTIGIIARITHTPALPSVPPATSIALPRGAGHLDLDESMKAAMQFLPKDSRLTVVSFVNNGELYFFYQPSSGTNDVEGRLLVNPVTGEVQKQEVPRNFTFAEKIVRVQVRDIHTGDFLGPPTRWIAGFFSFMLAALSVTGPFIWWNRRRYLALRGPNLDSATSDQMLLSSRKG